jgi:acyl-CoA dehydrogenase
MDFTLPPALRDLRDRVRAFVRTEVIPLEPHENEDDGLPLDLLTAVRDKARCAGVWAPQLPIEYGGLGLETMAMCHVF